MAGGFAVVGAPWDDSYAGSAHVYSRVGTAWSLLRKMSPDAGDSLHGFSVAAAANGHGVVGAPMGDGAATDSGTAYFLAHREPVYRFYNPGVGTHFYTPNADERDMVIATWPTIFSYEGVAYDTNPDNNTQPLYRFYNRVNNSHFYTAFAGEQDTVASTLGHIYSYDGETYAVRLSYVDGAIPVYRFYNPRAGSHFYTASEAERDDVIARLGYLYQYEGPAFYLGQ